MHFSRKGFIITVCIFAIFVIGIFSLFGAEPPTKAALFSGSFDIKHESYGVHPRLFANDSDFEAAKLWYRIKPKESEAYLPNPKKPNSTAPALLQDKENGQLAFNIAHIAVSWRVTDRREYLAALREWEPFLKRFQPLVFNPRNPTDGNRDLSAGALIMGMSIAYDTLKGQIPADEEKLFSEVLTAQAKQTYEDIRNYKSYHYEQNHLIIPVCSLGVAAMVLADELPEAKAWGVFARNLLDRSFKAIANDGWFFEGISYWSFTMQYPTAYAAALRRSTGEDLFTSPPFKYIPEYLEHMFLPNPDVAFDFADWGPRINTDGTFQKGWDQPWHTLPTRIMTMIPWLANREHPDKRLQEFVRMKMPLNTPYPALDKTLFLMGSFPPPVEKKRITDSAANPPYHWFVDMDIVHWRANWSDPDAVAIAFKSGPPAGHAIAKLYPLYPEWRAGLGHAHPDAGSFLLFAHGSFLAGDTGYAIKETKWHNTIAVDGIGQGQSGTAWAAFDKMPYETLNRIRMTNVWLGSRIAASTAVFHDAYEPGLGIKNMERTLILVGGRFLVVRDFIVSDKPHVYSWFLHSDALPQQTGHDNFRIENGKARLIILNLDPIDSFLAEPTMIDTQIYPGTPRLQQRGFHLELKSPRTADWQFLTAMDIQSKDENAAFSATTVKSSSGNTGSIRVDMKDGVFACSVFFGDQPAMSGAYAFYWYEKGKLVSVGLSGTKLVVGSKKLALPKGGSIVLRQTPDGNWKPEDSNPPVWRFE